MIIRQFRPVNPCNIYNNCINIYQRTYDKNIIVRGIQNVIQHFTKTITNLDLSLTSSILIAFLIDSYIYTVAVIRMAETF